MRVGALSRLLGGVSESLLNRLARLGVIPARRFPYRRAHWRFAESDVEQIREALVQAGVIDRPEVDRGDV